MARLEVFGTIWEGLGTTLFVSGRIQSLSGRRFQDLNRMEVAMNDILLVAPVDVSRRRYGLATLRKTIAIWEERKRVRCQLEQMSKDNPHLIDDIGLTRRQVEAEIAKPFWQA
jgi:uncharacterized protein YjiS (DUF1127 family)